LQELHDECGGSPLNPNELDATLKVTKDGTTLLVFHEFFSLFVSILNLKFSYETYSIANSLAYYVHTHIGLSLSCSPGRAPDR